MITDMEEKVKELVPMAIKEAIEKHIQLGEPVVFADGDQIRNTKTDPISRPPTSHSKA